MKHFLLLLIAGVLVSACSDPEICCTNIDTAMTIGYYNDKGINLFDMENGYDIDKIKVYHFKDGEWKINYDANLDNPRGIGLIEGEGETLLSVFPSYTEVKDGYTETKIEFSEDDADIIRTEIDYSNGNEIATKVWYNGELKWDDRGTERTFYITK